MRYSPETAAVLAKAHPALADRSALAEINRLEAFVSSKKNPNPYGEVDSMLLFLAFTGVFVR